MFRVRFLIFLLAAALALAACAPKSGDMLANTMETKIFEHANTYCFGRFLVDIPSDAELKYQDNNYAVATIHAGYDVRKFRSLINETLENRKEKDRHKRKDAYEYIRSEYPDDSDKQIIVSRADLWGHISYELDAFTLSPKNKPGSGHFFYFSGGCNEEKLEKLLSRYRTVLSSVRYRRENEFPEEPGFCFKDGFVANDGKTPQHEYSTLKFRLPSHPDVWVKIRSSVHHIQEKTLLERLAAANAFMEGVAEGKIRFIREKKRTVNGMDGEEALVSFPAGDGSGDAYMFDWETLGEMDDPLKPGIHLGIETGYTDDRVGTASSLTKAQAIALYERVLESLRMRPVTQTPAPEADAAPQAQPADALPPRLATGALCPRTGHWRCLEDGKTLPLVEGQRMPYFLLAHPAPGWRNWLRGIKNTYTHETAHWEWAGEKADGDNG